MCLLPLIIIRLLGGKLRVGLKSITTETEIFATIDTFMLPEEGLNAGFSVLTNPAGAVKIQMKFEAKKVKRTYPLSVSVITSNRTWIPSPFSSTAVAAGKY